MAEPAPSEPPRRNRLAVVLIVLAIVTILLLLLLRACGGRAATPSVGDGASTAPAAPAVVPEPPMERITITAPTTAGRVLAALVDRFAIEPIPELQTQPWPIAYRRTVAYAIHTQVQRYLGDEVRLALQLDGAPDRLAEDRREIWLFPRLTAVLTLHGDRDAVRSRAAEVGRAMRDFLVERTADPERALRVEVVLPR